MRIGAHVSVAGGLAKAVGNARDAGCESLQVFVSNARGWAPPPVDPAGDERFRADLDDAGLGPLFVHAPYLVNFASATPLTRERSREVVAATLAKAASIGAAGVVVHAGQALASGRAAGLATTRETLLPLADTITGLDAPDLVLELTAGTRGALAARFEEMAELLAACDHHPRLKVCMDTCHAQAAGYDLTDPIGVTKTLDELFATLGDRVVLVHANDSRDPVGAGRDRHCPIGTGTIGDQGFTAILAHPALATLPIITETTGDPTQMATDLARLHHLRPPGGGSAAVGRVEAVPFLQWGAVPGPAALAGQAGELDAAVAPEQGRPRVGAGRPGEQPGQGGPDQPVGRGEGHAEAAGGVVGVDQELVTAPWPRTRRRRPAPSGASPARPPGWRRSPGPARSRPPRSS